MQRPRSAVLWIALSLGAVPAAQASSCPDPLFVCETDRPGKFVAICATEVEPGRRWAGIQYRFGAAGSNPELVFPHDAARGATSLLFSHVQRGQDYRMSIRFLRGELTYRLFSTTGKDGAGVTVSDANHNVVATIRCRERPRLSPLYLQRALACDLENPHGRAGCLDKPFREAP